MNWRGKRGLAKRASLTEQFCRMLMKRLHVLRLKKRRICLFLDQRPMSSLAQMPLLQKWGSLR
jgi:hypothetical protein